MTAKRHAASRRIRVREARAARRPGRRPTLLLCALALALAGPPARGESAPAPAEEPAAPAYAIVVEKQTADDAGWKGVVEALQKKHSARVFHWAQDDAKALRNELAAFRPRYVCFVARPDELAREGKVRAKTNDGRTLELPLCGVYYRGVCALMHELDDDPYDDALWAVLTAATPQDALRVVAAEPLVVRRGLSHVTSGWLEWLDTGVSLSEVKKAQKWVKEHGKPPAEVQGPDDTTRDFVEELNSGKVDMVSTSGHATEADWQMGYTYRSGQIIRPSHIARLPRPAQESYKKLLEATETRPHLLAVDAAGQVYPIVASNPKIYYSPGNCRIARVDGADCLALHWIHHGAMQFFGHVGLQTRSCYAWGIAEYFLALQGRFSYAEAVWLNQQALRWQVSRLSGQEKRTSYICCRSETCFPAQGKFYWETTVLYGDPAWQARAMPVTTPLYDQDMSTRKLEDGRTELSFTITMRLARPPSRPAAFLVDTPHGAPVEVKEGPEDLVVADNFVLLPFWKPGDPAPEPGKQYRAVVVIGRPASPEPPPAKAPKQ